MPRPLARSGGARDIRVMRYEVDTMDYLALSRQADTLPPDAKTVRIALLAEFATSDPVAGTCARCSPATACARRSTRPTTTSIDSECLDPGSGLHAFQPRYVIILPAAEKLKARFYARENLGPASPTRRSTGSRAGGTR